MPIANQTTKHELREYSISQFIRYTGANRQTAIDYLEAEEWDFDEALISYRIDTRTYC